MPDTPPAPGSTPGSTPAPGSQPSPAQNPEKPDDVKEGQTIPYDRFKSWNEARKTEQDELTRLRTAEQKRKDDEAMAKGEFTKVIEDLKPKAARAEALEKSLNSVIEAEMKAIPEARRSLVPDLPPEKKLEYITANRAFLMDAKPANVNHPVNPDGSPGGGSNQTFTHAQIRDPKFYEANRDAILKAQAEGRIRD